MSCNMELQPKIYKQMERILYVLQYSYPKNFRSTNFKIMNRKREGGKKVTFNQVQKKRNFQKEKKEKDEIAGRIVKTVQCGRKDGIFKEQILSKPDIK